MPKYEGPRLKQREPTIKTQNSGTNRSYRTNLSKKNTEREKERSLSRRKSEVESFEKIFETYDKSKETDEYKKLLSEAAAASKEKKIKYEKFSEEKFIKHDVQKMIYNLNKEYSHIKVVNNGTFMQRMTFDNFKRQTKEKRVKIMMEKNTAKIAESEKIKSFNRLILDANRRIDAQERLEEMKEKLLSHKNGVERKVTKEEWLEVYQKR